MQKIVAVFLAAALVVSSPSSLAYQALAAARGEKAQTNLIGNELNGSKNLLLGVPVGLTAPPLNTTGPSRFETLYGVPVPTESSLPRVSRAVGSLNPRAHVTPGRHSGALANKSQVQPSSPSKTSSRTAVPSDVFGTNVVFEGGIGKRVLRSLGLAGLLGEKAFPALQQDRLPPSDASTPPIPPVASNGGRPGGPDSGGLVSVTEDRLGNRWISGRKREMPKLAVTAQWEPTRLVQYIADYFGGAVAEVKSYARDRGYALDQERDRARLIHDFQWADFLRHRENLEAMSHHGHKKHQNSLISGLWKPGEESFRKLSKVHYVAGWRGLIQRVIWSDGTYSAGVAGSIQRAVEVQKHIFGFAVRVPYHLFDMFLFGFFRRDLSYMLRHYDEDFIPMGAGSAKKYLEAAWVQQGKIGVQAGLTKAKKALWDRLDSTRVRSSGKKLPMMLWAQIIGWSLADGLTQFLTRRLTLAVKSAIAMGIVAALSSMTPLAPFMAFHLVAIPGLGWVVGLAAQGSAFVAGLVLGHAGSAIIGAAWSSLIPDLVVGRVLNTLVLSTFLTFSPAHRQRLLRDYKNDYDRVRELTSWSSLFKAQAWAERFRTFISGVFWSQNIQSLMGLMTVGAEIEAIMQYGDSIDSLFNPMYHALTPSWIQNHIGRDFKVFHNGFAAIERPAGHSPIPFGGAITWGNVLLYKLENFAGQYFGGFNLTDSVYHGITKVATAVAPGSVLLIARDFHPSSDGNSHAAGIFQRITDTFRPTKHYESHQDELKARTEHALADAGDWQREIQEVKEHIALLDKSLDQKQKELAELEKQSRPITPQERAAYAKAWQELSLKDKHKYVEDKLGQREQLTHPKPKSAQYYHKLEDLDRYAQKELLPAAKDSSKSAGYQDSLAVVTASIKAAQEALKEKVDEATGKETRVSGVETSIGPELHGEILGLVEQIEKLQAKARIELAQRDSAEKLLAVKSQLRNLALKERRNGKDLMNLHMGLSQLAMVQDLVYTLNIISSAQVQIKNALALLDVAERNVTNVQDANAPALQAAQNTLSQDLPQWTRDAQETVTADKNEIQDAQNKTQQAQSIGDAVTGFQGQAASVLAQLGTRADIQAKLDKLPQVKQWHETGKPGDPAYLNIADIQKDLDDANKNIEKIRDGLAKIPTVPVEVAQLLIIEAPNDPEVVVRNVTKQQTLTILNDRKIFWKDREADLQSKLDAINRRLASTGGDLADDFGEVHPESLYQWQALERDNIKADVAKLTGPQGLATQIDQLAASINQTVQQNGGQANLPTNLSQLVAGGATGGDSLKPLQDAVKGYADTIAQVEFPTSMGSGAASDAVFQAKVDLLNLGAMLPETANTVVEWSRSDGYVNAISDALGILPDVQQKLQAIIRMHEEVIADIDLDVAFLNAHSNSNATPEEQEALKVRKTNLLQNKMLPPLQAAVPMLENLLKYQTDSLDAYDPGGDCWKLFDAKLTLYDAVVKARDTTLPWALAGWGASAGDKAAGLAGIQSQRDVYNKYLTGKLTSVDGVQIAGYYDDQNLFHKSVLRHIEEIKARTAPAGTFKGSNDAVVGEIKATESLYGEEQPFNLHDKTVRYGREKADRAQQFNAKAKEINEILAKIDALSADMDRPTRLAADFSLPTHIDPSNPDHVVIMQKLVDQKVLQRLGDQLVDVGEYYRDRSNGADTGNVTDGIAPSGTQNPVTLDAAGQIAIMTVNAGDRLVPSNNAPAAQEAPAAYALARFLFSDAVISASNDALNDQVAPANQFLAEAQKALQDGLKDLDIDTEFVDSDGASETSDQVIKRKLAIYGELHAFTSASVAFKGQKLGWDESTLNGTLPRVQTYYDSLVTIYTKGESTAGKDMQAINKRREPLQSTLDTLGERRKEVETWIGQLKSPDMSDLRRAAVFMDELQKKTEKVLRANQDFRVAEEQYRDADNNLQWQVMNIQKAQDDLTKILKEEKLYAEDLPPDLAGRVENIGSKGGSWMLGDDSHGAAQALVIKKKDFYYFLNPLLSAMGIRETYSERDVAALQERVLRNPENLSELLPELKVISVGADNADAFYLIYNTDLATNLGMQSASSVIMGNIATVGGNNLSAYGYRFISPVNPNNAPWGDKGVGVQVESLQGKNAVNYLDITFHRPIQNAPEDITFSSQMRQDRIFVFEDFALLTMGDRLYVGAAGFGDFSAVHPSQKTVFYGDSLKASYKFNEVMRLTAQQQDVIAKDPRQFFQALNLDFTGYDPYLNQNFDISAEAPEREYHRTQGGVSVDAQKALGLNPDKTLTVDFYVARQRGTDDYSQNLAGLSILGGFSIKKDDGTPWVTINNQANGEFGQKSNMVSDQLTISLPNKGIVFTESASWMSSGKVIYYSEVSKKFDDQKSASLGYGVPFAGLSTPVFPDMPNRLYATINTSMNLRQIWDAVGSQTAENLRGGALLGDFQKQIDQFLNADAADSQVVSELRSVYIQDVGHQLITQRIGNLIQEIQKLKKAGAFLDNSTVRGSAGFISNGVGKEFADRAIGGGPTASTYLTMSMSKTPKEEIHSHVLEVYREALNLQSHLMELTQRWQMSVAEMVNAQWEFRLARYMTDHAPSEATRKEAEVREAHALERLGEAKIRYNLLAGRSPEASVPFLENLNTQDMAAVAQETKKILSASNPLTAILSSLDPEELGSKSIDGSRLEKNPFNLLDWVKWVDMLSFAVGTQFSPDSASNQFFGASLEVRLPIYDAGKSVKYNHEPAREEAYRLQDRAALEQMQSVYREFGFKAQKDLLEGQFWAKRAQELGRLAPRTAELLSKSLSAYRNGMIAEPRLRKTVDLWNEIVQEAMQAQTNAALSGAHDLMYSALSKPSEEAGQALRLTSIDDAFQAASGRVPSLAEMQDREEAAAAWTAANARRIQKAYLSWTFGTNVTAYGGGFLPMLDITGLWLMPRLSLDFKSKNLAELEKESGEAHQEMFRQMKRNLEMNLALHFFQNAVIYQESQKLRQAMVPEIARLEQNLEEAKRNQARGGVSLGDVEQAQGALDRARMKREESLLIQARAQATINYLVGRPPQAPLDIDLGDPAQALERLKKFLNPTRKSSEDSLREQNIYDSAVAVAQAILDAKVKMARAEEEKIDKKLRLQNIRVDPIALEARVIGRMIGTLSDNSIADPQQVELARTQTLAAERARQEFDVRLERARNQAYHQWKSAQASGDTMNQLLLEAYLASLGIPNPEDPPRPAAVQPLPASFAELTNRARQAYEEASSKDDSFNAPARVFESGAEGQDSSANARYFYAFRDLGRTGIDRGFIEPWIEIRLSDREADPGVKLELAKQVKNLEDRIHRANASKAAALGEGFISEFEMNVRLLRSAQAATQNPSAERARKNYADIEMVLRQRIAAQARQLTALLHLDPSTPGEDLMRLVPEDPAGASGDSRAIAATFIGGIKQQSIAFISREIFDQGTPQSYPEDRAMQQLRADAIAKQMTYRGYTPVLVDGWFRGHQVWGAWVEPPDPKVIESKLKEILSDSVRKELEARGRMQEAVLQIQLLLGGVRAKIHSLEKGQALIDQASQSYLSAMALYENGMASASEVTAALDALSLARMDFAENVAALKSNFVSLVAHLETLGKAERIKKSTLLHPLDLDLRPNPKSLDQDLLKYWSWRMLDENFQAKVDSLLSRMDKPGPGYIPMGDINREAEAYRNMTRAAELVRHKDFDGPEKIQLLIDADPQGHREKLEALLGQLVGFLRADPQGLNDGSRALQSDLRRLLSEDVEAQFSNAQATQADALRVLGNIRDGWWHGVKAPTEMEAAFQRLKELDEGKEGRMQARQKLLEAYAKSLESPADFVMRDEALDGYLKAQEAFDREMIETFQDPQLRKHPEWGNGLHSIFNLRASIARQMDLFQYGRGLAAINALIELHQRHLAGLRFDRAAPRDWEPVSAELERLKEIREKWLSDPKELLPLYAITSDGVSEGVPKTASGQLFSNGVSEGERIWKIEEWHTREEIERDPENPNRFWIIEAGARKWEVQEDADGRMWIQDGDKKLELISGVDVTQAEARGAQSVYLDNARHLDLFKTLDAHDFALVGMGGGVSEGVPTTASGQLFSNGVSEGVRRGMDLKEFQEMHFGEGRRVFYFDGKPDPRTGLHRALHPLAALKKGFLDTADEKDHGVFIVVYDVSEGAKDLSIALDQFPTLESLGSYLQRMSTGDEKEKAHARNFARLEIGERGVKALMENLKHEQTRSLRAGWLNLKLESYGFAAEEDHPKQVYLTQKEFDKARENFVNASDNLAKARRHLSAMERETAKYRPDKERLEKEAADEQLRYQAVEARYQAIEKKFNEGIVDEKEFRRAQEEFRQAQKAASKKIEEFSKVNGKYQKAVRNRDLAEKAVREAQENLERSKTWRLFRSDDLRLTLDEGRALVGVAADPDYGKQKLDISLGVPSGKLTTLRGEIYAASVDREMNVVRYYQGQGKMLKAFKEWTRQGADGRDLGKGGEKTIAPNVRIVHYADPATGLPVLLNVRYLIEAQSDAKNKLGYVKHWGVWPWHWGNWVKETVGGIPNTAVEVIGGRDPNQHGFLGRVNMYKVEGGETDHHSFFYQVGRSVLVLDPFPDPVRWYYDPSEFPKTVRLGSMLEPGQNVWDKDPISGDKDVNFGQGAVERRLRQIQEDLSNARGRALGYFDGAVRTVVVETLRGRAGTYENPFIKDEVGSRELNPVTEETVLDRALEDGALVSLPGPESRWSVSEYGRPSYVETEEVRRTVIVHPGADGQKRVSEQMAPYSKILEQNRERAKKQDASLRHDAQRTEREYQASLKRRDDARDSSSRAWTDFQALKLRISRQETVDHMILRVKSEIAGLKMEIERLKEHLRDIQRRPPHVPPPARTHTIEPGHPDQSGGPDKPSRHPSVSPDHPSQSDTPMPPPAPWYSHAWLWMAVGGSVLAAIFVFLFRIFRRHTP